MGSLLVEELRCSVGGTEILKGVSLEVKPGQVHAIMGPNGSGKSTLCNVLMGHSGYEVTGGDVKVDGESILGFPTFERARRGLFLCMQYPSEVPGVSITDVLEASTRANTGEALQAQLHLEAEAVGLVDEYLQRSLNVDFSGGEKKRNETIQLVALKPAFAILDEIDSGLDVDALSQVARRIDLAKSQWSLGVLAITHYNRLLDEMPADVVSVFADGKIVRTGGPELAIELEASGYTQYV